MWYEANQVLSNSVEIGIGATMVGSRHTGQNRPKGQHNEKRTSGSELDPIGARQSAADPPTERYVASGQNKAKLIRWDRHAVWAHYSSVARASSEIAGLPRVPLNSGGNSLLSLLRSWAVCPWDIPRYGTQALPLDLSGSVFLGPAPELGRIVPPAAVSRCALSSSDHRLEPSSIVEELRPLDLRSTNGRR
ncbi:hypothetical protein R1flu_002785 [Riccia fluitans]|uniref:Uncharacterized protein n=1 Tax=Riccia fluitans TaxID=41844 RepID=A0ABD1Y7M4_9MARC